jgi:hypothetical protein
MDKRLKQDIDQILHQIDVSTEQTPDYPSEETLPSPEASGTTIHVYLEQSKEPVVELSTQAEDQALSPSPTLRTWFVSHKRLSLLVVCCILALMALAVWQLLPLLTASATVTIIPASTEITTITSVTVVPGAADIIRHQIPGRTLSILTLTQERTVKTTGTGYQQATAARGFIMLYNAALVPQTVQAGELLTSASGVQVVTDQDITIPAGNGATNGQATVPAHALQIGPDGNIGVDAINGPCCKAYVIARNIAFTGGQNARSFQMVTQQDINGAIATIQTSLNQSVQAALQAQVHSDETLVTPPTCTPTITSNHKAREEAQQVTVTIDQVCTGIAYNTQALQTLLTKLVSKQATKQLDTHYTLAGSIQATVTKSTMLPDKTVVLQVKGVGAWVYQFTETQFHEMSAQIAGKGETEAKHLLLQMTGVYSVSITVEHAATLPTDPQHIQILLVKPL